jgi:hypothetical protein
MIFAASVSHASPMLGADPEHTVLPSRARPVNTVAEYPNSKSCSIQSAFTGTPVSAGSAATFAAIHAMTSASLMRARMFVSVDVLIFL